MNDFGKKSVNDILDEHRQNWPEKAADIEPSMIYLQRLNQRIEQDNKRYFTGDNLQAGDFGVLVALRRSGEPYCLSPTALYTSLLLSSGGLTKVLNRLQDKGWIERQANPADSRSSLVKLTPQGICEAEQTMARRVAHHQQFLSALDQAERQQLSTLLAKLLAD